jgi:thiol:disulfide interchange protein DsbA
VKRRLFVGLLLLLPTLALAAGGNAKEYTAGEDYTVINPALPGGSDGKVQVVELFWYGCPHCFQFEPYMHDWEKSMPDNVEFVRIPAIFNNPRWKLHAAAYYTAEVLGVMDKFHAPFFSAIHTGKQRMASKEAVAEFFAGIGVDSEAFDTTFDSFAVQTKVRRAADLTKKYGISGVPSMAVDGKYLVDGPMAKSYENMIRIVNALAEKEAAAKTN